MTTRTFASLVPRLNPSVPGCPQYTAVQYIREAAIRVCERTLSWRYAQPTFNLVPGVHEYFFIKPSGTDVHVLFDAMMNDRPLERLTLEQALAAYPKWADVYSGVDSSTLWNLTVSGSYNAPTYNLLEVNGGQPFTPPPGAFAEASEPSAITQLTPDKFVVLPLPDNEQTYTVRMFYALKPSRSADAMDARVFDELEEAILHNALQHLLVLPDVKWSDRELAAYHAKQSLREITERRARANLGNMRGTMRATAPKFA